MDMVYLAGIVCQTALTLLVIHAFSQPGDQS